MPDTITTAYYFNAIADSAKARAARENGRKGGRPRATYAVLDARDVRAVVYTARDRRDVDQWLHDRAQDLIRPRTYYIRNPDFSMEAVCLHRATFC